VKEISVILKNNVLITDKEFKILNNYACPGKMWFLIQKSSIPGNYCARQRTVEYIFDWESLLYFKIVSCNILAYWDTEITKGLGVDQEYQIDVNLFIKPYYKD
jgi:hypothetical protein